jgi:hypothetical protein
MFRSRKECALVQLSPGVIGREFGAVNDLELFIIAPRHEGWGLSPIREFPCFVFICRLLIDNVENKQEIDKNDVEIVGWGELYRTREDAQNHVFT